MSFCFVFSWTTWRSSTLILAQNVSYPLHISPSPFSIIFSWSFCTQRPESVFSFPCFLSVDISMSAITTFTPDCLLSSLLELLNSTYSQYCSLLHTTAHASLFSHFFGPFTVVFFFCSSSGAISLVWSINLFSQCQRQWKNYGTVSHRSLSCFCNHISALCQHLASFLIVSQRLHYFLLYKVKAINPPLYPVSCVLQGFFFFFVGLVWEMI